MKNRPLCSICLILFLLAAAGVHVGKDKLIKELRPSPLEQAAEDGAEIVLAGCLYQKEVKDKFQVLYLKDNSIEYQGQSLKESRIIVYEEAVTEVHIGQRLQIRGRVSFFLPARNPGNFDQKLYYQRQDIHASIWAEGLEITGGRISRPADMLYELRQQWKSILEKEMGEEESGVLAAMLLGEKGEMDADLKELYQVNGIGHILAISGLHLSFIGIGMYRILRRLTGSYPLGGLAGILFLLLYILMIGFTVSALRALVMFLFRVGADMAGRHYDAPTALAASAVVVLLWRPLSLYDGGFWLSFGAVLAVLVIVPVVSSVSETSAARVEREAGTVNLANPSVKSEGRMSRGHGVTRLLQGGGHRREGAVPCAYKIGSCVVQKISQGLAASIGINVMILPILLYYFFEFPLYSFILNLFVIPLMSVILFFGIAGSMSALWLEPAAKVCFGVCRITLWIYKKSCEMAVCFPGARLVIGRPRMWQIAAYYIILFLALLVGKTNRKEKEGKGKKEPGKRKRTEKITNTGIWRRRAAVLLWSAGLVLLAVRWGENGKLTVAVLDVGQGDAIFIKGPDGSTFLVDGGSSDIKKAGQYRIEPFLKSQGVGRLDYVLISHGDSDHINGVEELIERQDIGVKIDTLVLPVQEVWDEKLEELSQKARSSGIRAAVIEPGQCLRAGELSVTCLQPGNGLDNQTDNQELEDRYLQDLREDNGMAGTRFTPGNEASMVLAVRYGRFDMLLTGDVEERGEEYLKEILEEQYGDCTWEVLKVAHHGSKNSSDKEILERICPKYALISAGRQNRYGHPHQETVERLKGAGSKVYSTQENGAIIMYVEGGRERGEAVYPEIRGWYDKTGD